MLKSLLANPDIQQSMIGLISALAAILTALVTVQLPRLLSRLSAAKGLQQNSALVTLVKQLAVIGIGHADEWAAAQVKGGKVPSGAEKLQQAIDAVKQYATGELAKWSDEKWGVAIQAHLPELRAKLSAPPGAVAARMPAPSTELSAYVQRQK